jgi:nifR3 family TIM-barrel protein
MKIGNLSLANNLFLAPMAGITDLPFRLISKSFGVSLVFTEMVSANGLVYNGARTRDLLRSDPREKPLAVQLFGEDPDVMAQAAALVEEAADVIDINMGCPVKKVVRSGAGSALMREPRRAAAVISAVRHVTQRPLTVKFRSGWDRDNENYLEFGHMAQEEGADAVTLHPRTRAQGFGGLSDWSHIRRLKQMLAIPVIGSGDVLKTADADRLIVQTGCDALMLGRGAYGNPWLARSILNLSNREENPFTPPVERREVALLHLDMHLEYFGAARTLGEMRKHLCWYARGLPGAANFRARINSTRSISEMVRETDAFFSASADQL